MRLPPMRMSLRQIKMAMSAAWVLVALIVAIAINPEWPGRLVVVAMGALPPLALLLLWNEPSPTMSERIDRARR